MLIRDIMMAHSNKAKSEISNRSTVVQTYEMLVQEMHLKAGLGTL